MAVVVNCLGELIGVVVVSALVAAAIVTLAIWLRCRRKKKTNNLATNLDLVNNKATLQTAVIMDTDKTIGSSMQITKIIN